MTPPIVQRLRDGAAAIRDERVSMPAMAQGHGPEAQGTLFSMLAMPRLLPVPAVDTALAVGLGLVFRATLETVHVLSIIVWIGGMVFAHFFWRPAVAHLRY